MILIVAKFYRILPFFLILFAFTASPLHAEQELMLRDTITIQKSDGQSVVFDVEMALSLKDQEKGLMHRTSMPNNEGMLFLFPGLGQRIFWMKNTLIPLDILFIDMDGTILHIHHMAKPQDLTQITSEEPSRAVLELNGGISAKLGIKKGDKILHALFRNNTLAQ